jgi:hypothetical protein
MRLPFNNRCLKTIKYITVVLVVCLMLIVYKHHITIVTGLDQGTRRTGKHVELDNPRNNNNDRSGLGPSRRDGAPLHVAPIRQG